jgi:hypothetical protein
MVSVFTTIQACWTSPVTAPLNLSLEVAPSFQSPQASSHEGSSKQDFGIDYGHITNIVKTLAHDNDLDIRNFRLAIKDIKIDNDCKYGYIYGKRGRSYPRYIESYGVRTRFQPTNDGLFLHFGPPKHPQNYPSGHYVQWPLHSSLRGFKRLQTAVDEYLWRTFWIFKNPIIVDLDAIT